MASTGSSTSGTTTGSEIISSVNKKSGSGIDLKSLVTGLVNAETSVAQSQITKKVESTNLAISAFGTLTSKLDTLNTELTTLKSNTARSVASSNTAVILSVTDETIANDVYSEIEVSALAAGQVTTFDLTHASLLNSGSLSASSTIDTGTISLTINGSSTNITIGSSNNTLQDLVDEINAITGMQATLVDQTGSGGLALILRSDTGTANAFSLSSSDGLQEFNTSGSDASSSPITLTQAAADAAFTVDGLSVTRSSNSVTDLFGGYQLDLTAVTSDAVTIASSLETDDASTRMQSFLDSLNTIKSFLTEETKRGLNGAEPGVLAGDVTAQSILRKLSSLTTTAITGFGGTDYYLANLGVQTERDGSLSLDEDAFEAAITANPDILDVVFSSKYSSSIANLTASGISAYPPEAGAYSFAYSSGSTATLNGETLTAVTNGDSQKVFTGTTGDADNLSVTLVTDTATSGTVYYGRSLIDTLQDYVTSLTASSGDIKTRTNALNEDISTFADDQSDLDAKIEALTNEYNTKFGSMEAMVTQLNKTGEYLTSMMDAWNKKD